MKLKHALLISAMGLLTLAGCQQDTAEVSEPTVSDLVRPVKLFTVANEEAQALRRFPAEIEASEEADLAFRVSGQVIRLNVKDGQTVKKGELLAELDPTDFALQVELSEANYRLAKSQFDRIQKILSQNAATQAQFDEAKAGLDQASNALQNARNQLAYTKLYAPYDGVIATVNVENFQYIGAAQGLMHIQNLEDLDVSFQIPERLVGGIRQLTQAQQATVEVDALPDFTFYGVYKEHQTTPDVTTKAYNATLSVRPKGDALKQVLPGMTATVTLDINRLNDQQGKIQIPIEAVVGKPGAAQPSVWVYDPATQQVAPRVIKLGDMQKDSIIVVEGLRPGDQIVAAGVHSLTADMKVRPWQRERGI
ncbi:efflux RND transporter periplasmic adaptor subunit [Maribrevibacterium harenarium]|uniref:Efflux RND transporter periplasmic adaptor subunit n=1 Tax=Maribrevibacterium harenarium TaxID=2589817 RepID=A0A501WLX2_9GAMM|nr:efflux RND transporter periplasmic adaptor subunit [Maribrevibacterium harenarium]TPE48227.1 efflux RND transporter periplasmic adaptor subunit [Maribrevibacterium harenarium]